MTDSELVKQFHQDIANNDYHTTASLIGVTHQAVRYWINGKREVPPPVVKLIKLVIAEPQLVNYLW